MHDTRMRRTGPYVWTVYINDFNSSMVVRTQTRSARLALGVARQELDKEGRRDDKPFRPTPVRALGESS